MRILTIGSGGREHALVWALRKTSTRPLELFCAPGNAGIAQDEECRPVAANDIPALVQLVEEKKIDLTIVGPEAPLAVGIVDEFNRRGLRIVGPESQAARLESSKAFAKDFMRRHRVSTARYRIAESLDEARAILESGEFGGKDAPVVVKADGLAAGKAVIIAGSRAEAVSAVRELMTGDTVSAEAAPPTAIAEPLPVSHPSLLSFSSPMPLPLIP